MKSPHVSWAQRKNLIFLTVDVAEPSNTKVDLKPEQLTFSAHSDLYNEDYSFDIEFFAEVDPAESKYHSTGRYVHFILIKKDQDSEFWPRLTKEKVKHNWIGIDWRLYVDEDEEEEAPAAEGAGANMPFDMSQFANIPGMENMDFSKMGLGDMDVPQAESSDSSDDDE
ncbi:hypothetical protein GEMRC1_008125 [Eukaryota sp. GEM-RC1]